MSGSSWPSALLHEQGVPAPQVQPISSSHGLSGWFSHTHPMPKHLGQFLSILLFLKGARPHLGCFLAEESEPRPGRSNRYSPTT